MSDLATEEPRSQSFQRHARRLSDGSEIKQVEAALGTLQLRNIRLGTFQSSR